jgi:mono/diheme cytochrome c family protein
MNRNSRRAVAFGVACLAAATALACKGKDDEGEAAKILGISVVTERDRAEAREIFSTRCMPCHGPNGGGDGPASAALVPKPRNFHDTAWQSSISNEDITKIIRFGGPAVGKSPVMPANADLQDRGAIIAALTGRVRAFGK